MEFGSPMLEYRELDGSRPRQMELGDSRLGCMELAASKPGRIELGSSRLGFMKFGNSKLGQRELGSSRLRIITKFQVVRSNLRIQWFERGFRMEWRARRLQARMDGRAILTVLASDEGRSADPS